MEGTEDLGMYGKSNRLARYAMVFIGKGLATNWKHVVANFLYHNSIKANILKQMVIDRH